jgi:predicted oxidoreductase
MLQRTLLDHLDLFSRQYDEIDVYGDEYAHQLRGEAVATMIALRELWRFVPELID